MVFLNLISTTAQSVSGVATEGVVGFAIVIDSNDAKGRTNTRLSWALIMLDRPHNLQRRLTAVL